MDFHSLWPVAAAVFLLAGTIKGLVGIGLPTAVVGLLSQFIDPRQAIALMLLPMIVSNIFQAYRSRMIIRALKRFWPFIIVMAAGILIFTHYAAGFSPTAMKGVVGATMIAFVLVSLLAKPLAFAARYQTLAQLGFGLLAGIMGGLTSLWAPPLVVYLMSQKLGKDEFVGALGILLLAGATPLLIGYWQAGLTSPLQLGYSALMVIPTLAGVMIGEQGRRILSGDQFRHLLLFIFFILGANLLRTALV